MTHLSINHPTGRPNFTFLGIGTIGVWFSYKTPVAIHTYLTGMSVRENDWGPTTGKHLNHLDGGDKKTRLPSEQFEQLYSYLLANVGS